MQNIDGDNNDGKNGPTKDCQRPKPVDEWGTELGGNGGGIANTK